jgi:hypothetical protein
MHVFESGSFWSAGTATGSPVPGNGFVGIAAVYFGGGDYITIRVMNLNDTINPGRTYARDKRAGVWGPWAGDGTNQFVELAGDTMTGELIIQSAEPKLTLSKTTATNQNLLQGTNGVAPRWEVALGDGAVESGSNTGSNFAVYRNADDGSFIGTPLAINRSSGQVVASSFQVTTTALFSGNVTANGGISTTSLDVTGAP